MQQHALVTRRALLAGLAGLAALPLTACGDHSTPVADADLVRAKGVGWRLPSATAPVEGLTEGMVTFAHDLCRASASGSRNWVASPLSIATAFAMARVGARGPTATALDAFFGFPASGASDGFNAIIRKVTTVSGPPGRAAKPSPGRVDLPPVVSLGNALFTQRGLALRDDFMNVLASEFGAGVRTVDFTTKTAVDQINKWVSEETAGRIDQLFSSLDGSTKLVIANTIYLRASWLQAFGESPTVSAGFTRTDGRTLSVPTMVDVGQWQYATGAGGWQALAMPYASGNDDGHSSAFAMWLILPPPGGNPADMLAPAILTDIAATLREIPVDVAVPKWNFATTIDLSSVLTGMGLDDVFGTGDFSGIATGISGVSSAVHKANIAVDEFGTEAAAATGLAYAISGMTAPATTFHANRPFAFTIVGGPTHLPLFSGVVSDPSAG
jgi:serpin B